MNPYAVFIVSCFIALPLSVVICTLIECKREREFEREQENDQ